MWGESVTYNNFSFQISDTNSIWVQKIESHVLQWSSQAPTFVSIFCQIKLTFHLVLQVHFTSLEWPLPAYYTFQVRATFLKLNQSYIPLHSSFCLLIFRKKTFSNHIGQICDIYILPVFHCSVSDNINNQVILYLSK